MHRPRPRARLLSGFIHHDLLSTAKIGTVAHARKDAKTTNAGSLGTKAGGRRRTSITRRFEAGYKGLIEADAQGGSESIEAVPAADWRVAWMDQMVRARQPAIFWLC